MNCFKLEWKRFGLRVMLIGFFVVTIMLFTVAKPYMDPVSIIEVLPHERLDPVPASRCNFSGKKSNFCELSGDIRIHGNSSSIFFNSEQLLANKELMNYNTMSIKLYPRKTDSFVMGRIKELWLKPLHSQNMPKCTTNHALPDIVFSTGGYSGNIFHDTIDILIPLYLTSLHFNGEVQLLAQDYESWWIKRHEITFKALSNYDIIDLNHDKDIRRYNHVIVRLKAHQGFLIDPNKDPFGLTLRNFTQFNRKIYSLERKIAINMTFNQTKRPRLLIISRKKTRTILNEDELVNEAQSLGYNVKIMDARTSLKNFSKIVNSMDVMVGVHGAGLTNMMYLPENAVIIQIVGIGMQPISRECFEVPARAMNLKYLKYEVSELESSLIQQFSTKHQVITNPANISIRQLGWLKFKSIYLDNQNIRLDMSRFKIVLLEALELLRA